MSQINYIIEKDKDIVKKELTEILKREIKKDYVKTDWDKFNLKIKIEKMGSSEIIVALEESNNCVKICEKKRNIAMMHKPFISEVEKIVENIMLAHLGAKKGS